MAQQDLADLIWNVADTLRGDFKQSEFGRIILPFTVLRRLECVLEPTRDAVRSQFAALKGSDVDPDLVLPSVAGGSFYNTSEFALTKERDALIVFSESLAKFVRNYEYVAQLVDFADPRLEAFSAYARLLRKRLKGVSLERVDLGDLTLTHFKATRGTALEGVAANEPAPEVFGSTDNGTRDARDREKKYLSELIARLNEALGKAISD